MNNIMDLIDFERRGEYVLADVKSATWFFDRGEYVLADVKSATWFFECRLVHQLVMQRSIIHDTNI
jgi:hypothetical protein